MPSRNLNRILWLTVMAAIALFAIKAQDVIDIALSASGKLETVSEPSALHLTWRGKIEAPMAQKIAEAFDKHRNESGNVVLTLSSPGGSLGHGAEVIRLLRRIAETHNLTTDVTRRGICASMCVPVYLQGRERKASEAARFMFHEVSFREGVSDDEVNVPAAAIGSATDRFFERYFVPAGVPASWIKGVRAQMTGGNDIWKTAAELEHENAGIVQQVY